MAASNNKHSELEKTLAEYQGKIENLELHISALSSINSNQTELIYLLLSKIPFGVALIDKEHNVIQLNEEGATILGKSQKDVVGESCANLFNCLDEKNGCVVLNNNELDKEETICEYKDGSKHVLMRSAILNNDGNEPVVVEAFIDISEKKKIEEELVSAAKAKDEFLGMISHELRTPLNAIMGYTSLLQEKDIQQHPEQLNKFIGNIESAGKNLLHVIDGMLEISELTAGNIVADKLPIDISIIVMQLQYRMEKECLDKGNTFEIHEQGIAPFMQDLTVVMKVVYELLSNANKFTRNGTITLNITVERTDNQDWLVFYVADTGCGMSAKTVNDIFKAFSQGDTSETREFSGMGLGLTIVEKLVDVVDGKIEVTSKLGEGTEFIVKFPYEPVLA